MPHIAINAHLLHGGATYRSAGIHSYIHNLLRRLPAAAPEFTYTVFAGAGRPEMPGAVVRRTRLPTQHPLVRLLWEQTAQPWALRRARPDLLHAAAFVAPLWGVTPFVVTVYDLSFRLTPRAFPPGRRLYLSLFTAHTCRRARRVIAISQSTRRDVARLFGVAAEQIDVAYPGVGGDQRRLPRAEVEAFRLRRGLPEKFILYLGTLEPRKNLPALIRAFAQLQSSSPDLHLVLAGARGWLAADLDRQVEALGLNDRVAFPGFVSPEELALWYNAAAVFAYPSSFEGFGLPVLEALACGRPVVTSNVSSLPEAGGDVALQVPPHDSEALADALRRALTLADDAGERGPAHAARFSWQATAEQTVASYRRALGAAD